MRPNGWPGSRPIVLRLSTPRRNEIRTPEVIGSRCLATDLAIGLPIEHGPKSTLLPFHRLRCIAPSYRQIANMERKQLILNQSSGTAHSFGPSILSHSLGA
jgi:hypothetical protein